MKTAAPASESLLERLRNRDPEAIAQAVHDHAMPLLRAARAIGFPNHEAEDLVQDVFTTFLEKAGTFEGRSQLGTWLFGILHRKALERRRALRKDNLSDPVDQVFESRFDARGGWARPPADLEQLMLSQEIGEMIGACMDNLSLNQREVFVLREVEGFETGEICKILGLSVTNIGVQIHRARMKLRECLEAKGLGRQRKGPK